jgi:hypothetical protein
MYQWYLSRRSLWPVATQFALVTALVLTLATIAKYGL